MYGTNQYIKSRFFPPDSLFIRILECPGGAGSIDPCYSASAPECLRKTYRTRLGYNKDCVVRVGGRREEVGGVVLKCLIRVLKKSTF